MSNKLQVGMKFDNMIKLCEFIGWKYDYKHSTRLSQKLRQYVEFHRENRNKIIIDKVIDPNIEMVQFKPKRNGYDYNVEDIVEVNTVPGIHMHMRPSEGEPRNVAKYMVDMIFPETKEQENDNWNARARA